MKNKWKKNKINMKLKLRKHMEEKKRKVTD